MVPIIIRPAIKLKSVIICKRYLSSYYLSIALTAHEESQEVVKPGSVCSCLNVVVKCEQTEVLWHCNN